MKADRLAKVVAQKSYIDELIQGVVARVLKRERARVRWIIRSETWVNIADLLAMIDGTYKRVSPVKKLKPDKPSTQWLGPQISRNRRSP